MIKRAVKIKIRVATMISQTSTATSTASLSPILLSLIRQIAPNLTLQLLESPKTSKTRDLKFRKVGFKMLNQSASLS